MTPEQIEQHRKRFEELMSKNIYWRQREYVFGRYESGIYRDIYIEGAWNGYLLCVENITVRELAESQGIKVKP